MNQPIILPKKFYTPKKVFKDFLRFLFLLALIFGGYFFWKYITAPHYPAGSPGSLIYCYHDTSTGTVTDWDCIKKTVGLVLDTTSTKDFMDSLTSSGAPEIVSSNCHAIAHNIGAETLKRSKGIEDALLKCTNTCGAGCVHGAIGGAVLKELGEPYSSENIEHASRETIEKMGEKYCNHGNPMCHAVGHILYISTTSYTGALESCEKISTGDHREACYNGVFMQGVGGESEGLFSGPQKTHIQTEDFSYPCSSVGSGQLHACLHYLPLVQNGLFREKNIRDRKTRENMMNQVCEKFPAPGRADCFEGIGFFVDAPVFPDEAPTNIEKRCENLETLDDRKPCTRGIVGYYMYRFEYSPLMSYCEKIPEPSRKNTCYESMFDILVDGDVPKNPLDVCKEYPSFPCTDEYKRYIQEGK